jgi:hypothetical protein
MGHCLENFFNSEKRSVLRLSEHLLAEQGRSGSEHLGVPNKKIAMLRPAGKVVLN